MNEIDGMRSIAVALLALLPAACGEIKDERYPDFKAARDSGTVQRGWIPIFLPQSAYDIRDVHDLDSNAQSLSFRVPVSDIPTMVADMAAAPASEAKTVRRVIAAAGWSKSAPVQEVATYRLCQEGRPAALTVNAKTGDAFYMSQVIWRSNPCLAE
jgi:hypothetical protein